MFAEQPSRLLDVTSVDGSEELGGLVHASIH